MVLGEEPFQRGFINWSVDSYSIESALIVFRELFYH